MGFVFRRSTWRVLSAAAAVVTAAALKVGVDDLSHPELHGAVAAGTIELAHWCFSAAMILMLAAVAISFIVRNLGGATVAWLVVAAAGLVFHLGGYNLAGATNHFTASGAAVAMVSGFVTLGMFAALIWLELGRATDHEAGLRQFA